MARFRRGGKFLAPGVEDPKKGRRPVGTPELIVDGRFGPRKKSVAVTKPDSAKGASASTADSGKTSAKAPLSKKEAAVKQK
jgi:hypothetical protein